MFPLDLSLGDAVPVLLVAAAVIAAAGVAMAREADRLADRTGLGEAVSGAVLMGACTSLPGLTASMMAAAAGNASLAVSNAIGGILVQTAFIVGGDWYYRQANLEHAAASAPNLLQGTLLVGLLAVPLVAGQLQSVTLFSIHPATFVMVALYVAGTRFAAQAHDRPMWRPERTAATREDVPDEAADAEGPGNLALGLRFAGLVAVLFLAGVAVAEAGLAVVARSGLSGSLVGLLFTSVATSLPELVTTLAAVRRGALTLAVGGIIGGNTFDVLFLAMADIAYRDGSLYHALDGRDLAQLALAVLMTAVLLTGLLRRERHGPGNVGFEGILIVALYGFNVAVQAMLG